MSNQKIASFVFAILSAVMLWMTIPPRPSSLVEEQATLYIIKQAPKGKKEVVFRTQSGQNVSCRGSEQPLINFSNPCPVSVLKRYLNKDLTVRHNGKMLYYLKDQNGVELVTYGSFTQQIIVGVLLSLLLIVMSIFAKNSKSC